MVCCLFVWCLFSWLLYGCLWLRWFVGLVLLIGVCLLFVNWFGLWVIACVPLVCGLVHCLLFHCLLNFLVRWLLIAALLVIVSSLLELCLIYFWSWYKPDNGFGFGVAWVWCLAVDCLFSFVIDTFAFGFGNCAYGVVLVTCHSCWFNQLDVLWLVDFSVFVVYCWGWLYNICSLIVVCGVLIYGLLWLVKL